MAEDFQYVKLPDGSYGKFRADAKDDVIRAAIQKDFPDAFKAQATPSPMDALGKTTGIGPAPSILDRLRAGQVPGLDEMAESYQSVGNGKGLAAPGTFMGKVGQTAGMLLKNPATQAITGTVSPEAADAVVPSTARAGKKLEDVMSAARNVPIKPGEPTAEAFRGKEIASRGGQLPKILRDFVRRTSDPEAPPITYEEGRDFYTNARLAMSEYLQTKPNMWRQVTIFKNALGNAISDAAHEVGKGSEYLSGMAEYRRAKRMQDLIQAAAKIGIPLAIGYEAKRALSTLAKAGE